MSNGTKTLWWLTAFFTGLSVVAVLREQFVVSAVFGFSAVLCLAAEALWLLGENRKIHH